jgi:hypothetical protein
LVEVLFEPIEMGHPELAIRRQPVIELGQGLGPDVVDAALRVGPRGHHPGLFEDAQVFGYGGLAEVEVVHQVAYGSFPIPKQTDDGEALGIAQDLHGGLSGHLAKYASEAIYLSSHVRCTVAEATRS